MLFCRIVVFTGAFVELEAVCLNSFMYFGRSNAWDMSDVVAQHKKTE